MVTSRDTHKGAPDRDLKRKLRCFNWAEDRVFKRSFFLSRGSIELKIIAAILKQPVIEKILTHLGLQARAPPRSPARGQALQVA